MKVKTAFSTVVSFALLLSLLAVPTYAAESKFSDVSANAYYADAVAWAVEQGITSGTSATTFSPGSTCTRAQILTFIWRANGSPEPDLEKINAEDHNPFRDLDGTEYYFKAAQWAFTKGMVAGGMDFDGDKPCSRSSAVTYLWKEAGEPLPAKEAGFTDIIRALHDMNAISWAVEQGITSGTSATTFSPDQTCTRGQIVTFLYRAMGKSGESQQQTQQPEQNQKDPSIDMPSGTPITGSQSQQSQPSSTSSQPNKNVTNDPEFMENATKAMLGDNSGFTLVPWD